MTLRSTSTPLPALLLASLSLAPLAAQSSLPIQAEARIDTDALATTGRATIALRFVTETELKAPLAVRVELHSRGKLLQ
ncbi:MAG: hypothetical protein KAI24_19080, partial [Planctomycetes bacterium]|nr:hypothetical protein [Planctomycetota bacterium]